MKLVKIFLSSFLLLSCDPSRKVILFSIENDKNTAHPYLVEGVNKKNGELALKTLPDVALNSPGLNNAVCVTYNDYAYGSYLFKRWYVDSH